MSHAERSLAVVTGASTGIGLELARIAAADGCDLVICANEARINEAAAELRQFGVEVVPVEAELSTSEGVGTLIERIKTLGRPVDHLLANAGRGQGGAFLDQELGDIRHTVATNVTGTIELIHRIGNDMRQRGAGRIMITGSIAGFIPGSYQAVYNATKAFLNNFGHALRDELKDSGVSVTVLMPGATETAFFERADMLDTKIGTSEKDDPTDVAKAGYDAMMAGRADVVTGAKNKVISALANVVPAEVTARQQRKMAKPGSA